MGNASRRKSTRSYYHFFERISVSPEPKMVAVKELVVPAL
jgi:hypothetical protein